MFARAAQHGGRIARSTEMLDLTRNLGRLSLICANALLILSLAAASILLSDAPPRDTAPQPPDWRAPLRIDAQSYARATDWRRETERARAPQFQLD